MPTAKTTCESCGERIGLITNESVEIIDCPECGKQSYKVSTEGVRTVPDREERHKQLRKWDEEVLQD